MLCMNICLDNVLDLKSITSYACITVVGKECQKLVVLWTVIGFPELACPTGGLKKT